MFFFLQRHLNNIHVTFCREGAAGVAINILKFQIKSVSVNQFTPISSHCSTNNHMKRFSFSSSLSLYTRYHLGINLCSCLLNLWQNVVCIFWSVFKLCQNCFDKQIVCVCFSPDKQQPNNTSRPTQPFGTDGHFFFFCQLNKKQGQPAC